MSLHRGDRCQRCGEVGEDRRTLWHACFYALEELGLPFAEEVLFHAGLEDLELSREPVQIDLPAQEGGLARRISLAPGAVRSKGDLTPHKLYTLRVCKECRADWMSALRAWFHAHRPSRRGCGSGIFVRELGGIREVTREEWDDLQAKKGESG